MFTNLWAFIKGAIGGLIGCVAFVIIGALTGMTFTDCQWLLYWFFCIAFFGGFVVSASETGFGILALVLFLIGLGGTQFFAIKSVISLYNSEEFFVGLAMASLAISGILFLRWYMMIGEGDAESSWLFTFLTVLIGLIAGYFLTDALGVLTMVIISGIIDGVCLLIMLGLRIKNGSALDY